MNIIMTTADLLSGESKGMWEAAVTCCTLADTSTLGVDEHLFGKGLFPNFAGVASRQDVNKMECAQMLNISFSKLCESWMTLCSYEYLSFSELCESFRIIQILY